MTIYPGQHMTIDPGQHMTIDPGQHMTIDAQLRLYITMKLEFPSRHILVDIDGLQRTTQSE